MKWCAVLLVVCTGCLQPNPSFKPGSTSGGSETASGEDTVADIGTTPSTADDEDDDGGSSTGTTPESSGTTTDPAATTEEGSEVGSTTGAITEHTIFVSSVDAFGDIGSIAAVDELCNQLATDAGLDGTWLAVLSDSTVDARERISVTAPIRNVMGDLIAEDQDDLWDGFIGAPVRYNESGEEFLASPFTGTQPDGTAAAENCENWTRASGGDGMIGDAGYAGSGWIETSVASCNHGYPFYCISQ
jgi:hypothetical protein